MIEEKSEFLQHFKKWLIKSKDKFSYEPKIIKETDEYISVKFSGISENLSFKINKYKGAGIHVNIKPDIWDMIKSFDKIIEKIDRNGGYYCNLCLPEHVKIYDSKYELWENHCYQEVLSWINHNFVSNNWIVVLYDDGVTNSLKKQKKKQKIFINQVKKVN